MNEVANLRLRQIHRFFVLVSYIVLFIFIQSMLLFDYSFSHDPN